MRRESGDLLAKDFVCAPEELLLSHLVIGESLEF